MTARRCPGISVITVAHRRRAHLRSRCRAGLAAGRPLTNRALSPGSSRSPTLRDAIWVPRLADGRSDLSGASMAGAPPVVLSSGSHHRPGQGRIRLVAVRLARTCQVCGCGEMHWPDGGGPPSRREDLGSQIPAAWRWAGPTRFGVRHERVAWSAGFGAAARRPLTCTGAVAVVVTELAARVKPAVPGGSLAGPRRPRRTR
jgi:hypothetical protein